MKLLILSILFCLSWCYCGNDGKIKPDFDSLNGIPITRPRCPIAASIRPHLTSGRGNFRPGSFATSHNILDEPRFRNKRTEDEDRPERKTYSYKGFLLSGRGKFRPGFNADYWESLMVEPNFV